MRMRRSLLPTGGEGEGAGGGAAAAATATTAPPPCGDIFANVARGDGDSSPRDDEYDDYDARLCDYARGCEGESASTLLLPLVLCRGGTIDPAADDGGGGGGGGPAPPPSSSRRSAGRAIALAVLLPPALLAYLVLLFRLLATTADSYFSPALESFSFELGLPPRFAGATLLALGNGSPDLGSTVNSILLWNEAAATSNMRAAASALEGGYNEELHQEEGWTMSLGSLAGGGMFVGTVVCGLLIRSCDGIACRLSFLRDVSMYALSVCVVWRTLESGTVSGGDVGLFFGMYLAYITIILASDLYHRRVTLRRLREEKRHRRRTFVEGARRMSRRLSRTLSRALSGGDSEGRDEDNARGASPTSSYARGTVEIVAESGTAAVAAASVDEATPLMRGVPRCDEITAVDSSSLGTTTDNPPSLFSAGSNRADPSSAPRQRPRLSVTDRFAMLMSNYDPSSVRFTRNSSGGDDDEDDDNDNDEDAASEWRRLTAAIHEIRPGMHHHHGDQHLPGVDRGVSQVPEGAEGEEGAYEEEAEEDHRRGEGNDNVQGTQSSWQRRSSSTMEPDEESVIADGGDARAWSVDLFADAYDEIRHNYRTHMKDSFRKDEHSLAERIMAFLELPFVALRTVSFAGVRFSCENRPTMRLLTSTHLCMLFQDDYPHPLRG